MLALHDLVQAYLLITSALTVYFVARTDKWHKWGFIFGLLSEPGWFYASWVASQWGTTILAVWWTYSWGIGAWRRFSRGTDRAAVMELPEDGPEAWATDRGTLYFDKEDAKRDCDGFIRPLFGGGPWDLGPTVNKADQQ